MTAFDVSSPQSGASPTPKFVVEVMVQRGWFSRPRSRRVPTRLGELVAA
jgi:hypothetical protein